MVPCELASSQWTFTKDSPSSVADGNYYIQYGNSGNYLNSSGTAISVSKTQQSFYVRTYSGTTYLLTVDPIDSKMTYGVVTTTSSESKLIVATGLQVQNNIILTQDNSIFNVQSGVRYVPAPDNSVIPGNGKGQWNFTPVPCNIGTRFPTGSYIINSNNNYLIANNGILTITSQVPAITTFPQYIWYYDSNTGKLSTQCGTTPYYINYDSKSQLIGLSTTASTSVVLTGSYIVLDPVTVAVVSVGNVIGYSCLTPSSQWNINSVTTPPVSSMVAGSYQLKLNGLCVNSNGQMDSCSNAGFWEYNPTVNTLTNTLSGECLLNKSSGICALESLTVGSCDDLKTSGRFILGTNGQLYDPVTNLCYTQAPQNVRENYMENYLGKEKRWVFPLIVSLCLLLAFLGIYIMYRRKRKL